MVLKLCVHENWASMVAQTVKNLPAMQENGIQYLRLTNCRPHSQSSGPKVWDLAYDFFFLTDSQVMPMPPIRHLTLETHSGLVHVLLWLPQEVDPEKRIQCKLYNWRYLCRENRQWVFWELLAKPGQYGTPRTTLNKRGEKWTLRGIDHTYLHGEGHISRWGYGCPLLRRQLSMKTLWW